LVCELIVFVMVLSAAVYFIPLICSYSDAITTGIYIQKYIYKLFESLFERNSFQSKILF